MFWNDRASFRLDSDLAREFAYFDPSQPEFHRCLGMLESLSLIASDSRRSTIRIHSQVHEAIHFRAKSSEIAIFLPKVIRVLLHRLPHLLYSCTEKEVPQQQELVLSHAERIKDMVKMYRGEMRLLHPDVCCFFLECFLQYRGESFLTLAQSLIDCLDPSSREWVASLLAMARATQVIESLQGDEMLNATRKESILYTGELCSINTPNGGRPFLAQVAIYHRLSQLMRHPSGHAATEIHVFRTHSSVSGGRNAVDTFPSHLLHTFSKSYSTYSCIAGIALENAVDTLPRHILTSTEPAPPYNSPSSMSSCRAGNTHLEAPSLGSGHQLVQGVAVALLTQYLARTLLSVDQGMQDSNIAEMVGLLNRSIGVVKEALQLGIEELADYYAVVIETVFSASIEELSSSRHELEKVVGEGLAAEALIGIIETNSKSIPPRSRSKFSLDSKAFQRMGRYISARGLSGYSALDMAFDILVEEPLLWFLTKKALGARWFPSENNSIRWSRSMLDSINNMSLDADGVGPYYPTLHDVRDAVLEIAFDLGRVLLRDSRVDEACWLFEDGMRQCRGPTAERALWAPNHEEDWAKNYISVLTTPDVALEEGKILSLCQLMVSDTTANPNLRSTWAELLFNVAVESGNSNLVLTVVTQSLATLGPEPTDPPVIWDWRVRKSRWHRRKLEQERNTSINVDEAYQTAVDLLSQWDRWAEAERDWHSRPQTDAIVGEILTLTRLATSLMTEMQNIDDEEMGRRYTSLYQVTEKVLETTGCAQRGEARRWLDSFQDTFWWEELQERREKCRIEEEQYQLEGEHQLVSEKRQREIDG